MKWVEVIWVWLEWIAGGNIQLGHVTSYVTVIYLQQQCEMSKAKS